MLNSPSALWLNTSNSLLCFDLPLINYLATKVKLKKWRYKQDLDQPSCLKIAVNSLDQYLQKSPEPVHLIGHSTAGLLGLLYARQHPEKVKSLTILGVGVNPNIDWISYYYIFREALHCSRDEILTRLVKNLFGDLHNFCRKNLKNRLEQALDSSISPHSLYQRVSVSSGGISAPLMVCGSQNDPIIPLHQLRGWRTYLKPIDRLWECPQEYHFFHYFQVQQVGEAIIEFWESLRQINESNTLTYSQIFYQTSEKE